MSRQLVSAALLLFALVSGANSAPEPLRLGVHPYLDSQEIVLRFTPLARYLETLLDRRVEIAVGHDYAAHIREIGEGRLDIAYLGPASYVELVATYGEVPLLARLEVNGSPVFHGKIVVRNDSSIVRLSDLTVKVIALGDPNSTMGTLVPSRMLDQAGVVPGQRLQLTGHENVALAVLSAFADAGAVKEEVYRAYAVKGLRAIAQTPAVSEHLFVAGRAVPSSLVERLRRALLSLAEKPGGLAVIRGIKISATGLVPVSDADYDSLR